MICNRAALPRRLDNRDWAAKFAATPAVKDAFFEKSPPQFSLGAVDADGLADKLKASLSAIAKARHLLELAGNPGCSI